MSETPPEGPAVGSEVIMNVVQAANRTTFFAEQAIVGTVSQNAVELILLRAELVIAQQKGIIEKGPNDEMRVLVTEVPIAQQLTDIGHVRMPYAAALDLAQSIVQHAVTHHGLVAEDFIDRLTQVVGASK